MLLRRGARRWASTLRERGEAAGVKYFQFSFVDMFGVQRSKMVPLSRVDEVAASGAGFAGFACHLRMAPTDGDLLAMPDERTVTVLPWNKEVAWVSCDLRWRGEELDHGPRNVLRRELARLREVYGLTLKTGVECEFFIVDESGEAVADRFDAAEKPCYEAHGLMRRYEVVSELVEAMEALGWGPYQADHEDANGQFEINWDYDDALVTADRVAFFKYAARSVCEKRGLRATFMPKPFATLTGSGCHCHVSLHDAATGANACRGPLAHGLSETATAFLAGVLDQAPALAAVANPTINSYKRLFAPTTSSGATWSPDAVCWGGNNRTLLVRVPDAPRLELRLADMAANPYLFPAAIAAAGMHGIAAALRPPEPADCNMYDASCPAAAEVRRTAPKLPRTLRHALAAFDDSPVFKEAWGASTVAAYLDLKTAHCDAFDAYLSPWERAQYLDS